ncbi:MAG: hypothetical protein ABEH83_13410 [Halobacterium sp.]
MDDEAIDQHLDRIHAVLLSILVAVNLLVGVAVTRLLVDSANPVFVLLAVMFALLALVVSLVVGQVI